MALLLTSSKIGADAQISVGDWDMSQGNFGPEPDFSDFTKPDIDFGDDPLPNADTDTERPEGTDCKTRCSDAAKRIAAFDPEPYYQSCLAAQCTVRTEQPEYEFDASCKEPYIFDCGNEGYD